MPTDASALWGMLRAHVADPTSSWSLGTFGALAEFHRNATEPARLSADALTVATGRGAMRIHPHPEAAALAYEAPAGDREHRRRGLVVYLPERYARRAQRRVLTEIGPDHDAIQPRHRVFPLFDLGLGAPHVDAFVRVHQRDLLPVLRAALGRPLLEPGNAALGALKAQGPQRVFVSELGRIEVYQPIPAAGASSPEGPHTHLLPELLALGRTHAADVPLPAGCLPCLYLHPSDPFTRGHKGTSGGPECLDGWQARLEEPSSR
jgi:hypothetical protein